MRKVFFDRALKRRQRQWSFQYTKQQSMKPANISDGVGADYYDYLRTEVTARLSDRLDDINRTFPLALELDCRRNTFANLIQQSMQERDGHSLGGIKSLIRTTSLQNVQDLDDNNNNNNNTSSLSIKSISCDEDVVEFPPNSFDLVFSPFHLHWSNDIQAQLKRINSWLRPDGVFIGAMVGGDTLDELAQCFYLADMERSGGFGPHMSPFAGVSDVAGLMQSIGFALPTVDVDTIQISYPDVFTLLRHLQLMGEGNALMDGHTTTNKDTLLAMASLYHDRHALEDGSITATFQIVYMIGWKADASQPKPCKRGSAKQSLKTISNTNSDTVTNNDHNNSDSNNNNVR